MVYRFDPVGLPSWWREPKILWGMWDPFWVRNFALVGQFVKKHKLDPIPLPMEDARQGQGATPGQAPEALSMALRWPDIRGGLRFPHLHVGLDIFRPTDAQWKIFTAEVVSGIREKLNRAESINFEQLMELDKAVDTFL